MLILTEIHLTMSQTKHFLSLANTSVADATGIVLHCSHLTCLNAGFNILALHTLAHYENLRMIQSKILTSCDIVELPFFFPIS